jgi:hypothetical protein
MGSTDWLTDIGTAITTGGDIRIEDTLVDDCPIQDWSTVQISYSEKEPVHNNRKPHRFKYEL